MVDPDGVLMTLVMMKITKTKTGLQLQQLIQGTQGELEEAGFWGDDIGLYNFFLCTHAKD